MCSCRCTKMLKMSVSCADVFLPGYDNEWLTWATGEAGQDSGVGTYVYDAIYNCYDGGETIIWSAWCGGGGECNKKPSANVHAECKNEPVWTGRGDKFDYGK